MLKGGHQLENLPEKGPSTHPDQIRYNEELLQPIQKLDDPPLVSYQTITTKVLKDKLEGCQQQYEFANTCRCYDRGAKWVKLDIMFIENENENLFVVATVISMRFR